MFNLFQLLDSLIGFPYYFGGIAGWLLLNSPLTHMESMVLQQPAEMSAASSVEGTLEMLLPQRPSAAGTYCSPAALKAPHRD